mmetsp:Transcript_9693/g.40650  ORF Transcript_9693/g.40650 Transcript_9693/m.40650 type:complete len:266 (+) Transcript_9693:1184-1981(+)
MSYTFRPLWCMTCTCGRFFDARLARDSNVGTKSLDRTSRLRPIKAPGVVSSAEISASSTECCLSPAASAPAPSKESSAWSSHLVFASATSSCALSSTTTRPSASFAESATFKPNLLTLRCSPVSCERTTGPCATPPPLICGARRSPTRARPPPFCGRAFLVVPLTSARVLVLCKPRRRLLRCHTTTRCATSTRRGTSKMRPGSVTVSPVLTPVSEYTGTPSQSRMEPWSGASASRRGSTPAARTSSSSSRMSSSAASSASSSSAP